jgi:hypothetical protein
VRLGAAGGGRGLGSVAGGAGRQGAQVLVLVRVQFQGTGEGVGDGRARAGLLAALEPGVVVDAHPGERGNLLPAQPGGAAHADSGGEADVGRGDLGPPGMKETSQLRTAAAAVLVITCHTTQCAPAAAPGRRPRGAVSHPRCLLPGRGRPAARPARAASWET